MFMTTNRFFRLSFLVLIFLTLGTAKVAAQEAYAYIGNDDIFKLTFYYDNSRSARNNSGITYDINTGNGSPDWIEKSSMFETVEFASSFSNFRPTSTNKWFSGMEDLTTITGIENLNTSEVTNMSNMFAGCSNLESLNLSGFNTSKVTEMEWMFSGCTELKNLNVSNFNTMKVTSMRCMFSKCTGLTSLNLSSFNTSNVTDMISMFDGCSGLKSLNLSHFNTDKVENMAGMFCGCTSLTSLSISNFNTSKVENMSEMFKDCSGLTSLDVSRFNTSASRSMEDMFMNCNSLTNLDVSGFNTVKVHYMNGMFRDCRTLKHLNLSSFNTAEVTNMSNMFNGCSGLRCIFVGDGWNTNKVTMSDNMFLDCTSLTGGAGTAYNSAFVKKSFACVDGENNERGYLTSLSQPLPYAALSAGPNNTAVLTFYYDTNFLTHGMSYLLNSDKNDPDWYDIRESIVFVRFDSSFYNFYPTNVYHWFTGMTNLTDVMGLQFFRTFKVKDMSYMFADCSKLESLNLNVSSFNTENVKSMSFMFSGCSMLRNLDVSGFNTADVCFMDGMFYGCSKLQNLDITNFSTTYVMDMSGMFLGCSSLSSLDLSNFDTSWAEDMSYMFTGCSSLTTLDLGSFNTEDLEDMREMFRECSNLRTIYVGNGWNTKHVSVTASANMFFGCTSLVGGKGTTYNSSNVNIQYARIDQGPSSSSPGYLTPYAYAVYTADNQTLTFYYDNQYYSRQGVACPLGNWGTYKTSISHVVFHPSFNNAVPTSTANWFAGLTNLADITGIEYLHTDEVTSMNNMFYDCRALTSVDVSGFNTENVTDMSYMFRSCFLLADLDVTGFQTHKVTNMAYMFDGCRSLTSLNVNKFNTTKVTDMSHMFDSCLGLTYLGLSSFNTSKVSKMDYMFSSCSALETIYVGDKWSTAAVTSSTDMFHNCSNLVGGAGTIYDGNHVNVDYAHIDSPDSPGYFCDLTQLGVYVAFDSDTQTLSFHCDARRSAYATTYDLNEDEVAPGWSVNRKSVAHVVFDPSFVDVRPTTMYKWFTGMSNLTDITGSENLHSDNVTNMYSMFSGCSKLTTIDLSSFNTQNVTNMEYMFNACSRLTTIYAGIDWNTENVTESDGMFSSCTSLVGGNGTAFDEDHVDKEYACISGGTAVPSYLTDRLPLEGYVLYSAADHQLTFLYDGLRFMREKSIPVYLLNTEDSDPDWNPIRDEITQVVFAPSFANARPTTTYGWFAYMRNLTDIVGMENLNTSSVTNMGSMFATCSQLTTLNLDNFNTGKVKNMSYMFAGCDALTHIYVGTGWNTASVTNSTNMFISSPHLVGEAGTVYDETHTDKEYACVDGLDGNTGYLSYFAYAHIPDNQPSRMTFYHDGMRSQRGETGATYEINTGENAPEWLAKSADITSVIFDSSFANVYPTTTHQWFYGMSNLTYVGNLWNFNTSEVTDMASMFEGCTSLTDLYLRNFNTDKVTTMERMFAGCSGLTGIDLSAFNTSNVTNMNGMFSGCSGLKTLDLSNFNTGNVTDMSNMFNGCSSLTAISVGDDWSTASVTSSAGMFTGCNSLVGGNGTAHNSSYTDKTYARVDADGTPGYLSYLTAIAYVAFTEGEGGTLTFYYDSWRAQREAEGPTYLMNEGSNMPDWMNRHRPAHVVFDPSFADYRPTSMYMWFYEQYNLTDITGMEYLNTSEVTTMSLLFASCSKLTELDLSHFDTHNVTGMSSLFSNCSSLTTIYAGDGWNTGKVTAYGSIFNGCSSNLRGSAGTAYNSSHKDDITYARIDGGVDEPGYLSHKNEAYAIFTADDNTLTFYCDGQRNVREKTETTYNLNTGTNLPEWNEISADVAHVVFNYSFGAARPTSTYKWFSDMTNLVDIGDMIDNYDNLYFNTSEVTNMSYMFYNCRSLTGVDLTHFDTQKVTDMSHMFDGCRNLTTLDLSNFNTSQVTDMTSMFYDCRQLTTINVRAGWNTENVMNATSAAMFEGCTSLVGGAGTAYSAAHTNKEYARMDDPASGNPGYLTKQLEAYAFMANGDHTTLIFYCDDQRIVRDGETFDMNEGWWEAFPEWQKYRETISHVIFDPSFANARPTTTAFWFYHIDGYVNLTNITGLEYLNTESVLYMDRMFYGCSALTSLDVSHFNTQNVERMEGVFYGCTGLTSLNLSGWDTQNVVCMDYMFRDCVGLTTLDLSGWNTQNVETMNNMFYGCTSLTTLDLTGWTTDKVTDMGQMFNGCSSLTTIFASNWNLSEDTYDRQMFQNCNNLEGGAGTTYSGSHTGKEYARLDGGTSNPGYFSDPALREAYVVLSSDSTTLTFCYDVRRTKHVSPEVTYDFTVSSVPWLAVRSGITHIIFDSSFAKFTPTTTRAWFSNMSELTDITGLQYLNTSEVTDMSYMFLNCSKLNAIDVSHFNTAKVKDMSNMFNNCNALTSLDVSGFNTANVTDMSYMFSNCMGLTDLNVSGFNTDKVTNMYRMFYGCSKLTTIDVSGFNTEGVTNMGSMFSGCSGLTSLDVSNFNTSNVTSMYFMFYNCKNLNSLDLSDFNTANVTDMSGMFSECNNLKSLDVSGFNTEKVTSMNDMFNGCKALTSLDLRGFNTSNVTNMSNMFFACNSLTSLDLSSFNTSNVVGMGSMFVSCISLTNLNLSSFDTRNVKMMRYMFYCCFSLTNLDLSSFDTQNVTAMEGMFRSCQSLATIYASNKWSTEAVTSSGNMFVDCTSVLKGGAGTTWASTNPTDKTYARVDDPENDKPGYFTYKVSFQLGDVNGDNEVNVADITALTNILRGDVAAGTYNSAAADVDGDGEVKTADITELVNMILEK